MKQILFFTALFLSFMINDANAATLITGKAQYRRAWSPSMYQQPGARLALSDFSGIRPLVDVQICARNSAGVNFCGRSFPSVNDSYTDASGNFQIAVDGAGTYRLNVIFAGRSLASPAPNHGFRVVATNGSTIPLTADVGASFTVAAGSTTVRGTAGTTFASCVPTTSTCPNDFANGHQVFRYFLERMINLGVRAAVPGFDAGMDSVKFHTDRQSNSSCGFTGCCNFDFGMTNTETCAHEFGHSLFTGIISARGTGQYGNFPGQTRCTGEDGNGTAVNEANANLTALIMGYSIGTIQDMTSFTTPQGSFCFSTAQPAGDGDNNCSSCEMTPNLSSYPQPLACGTSSTDNVRRTECRSLRVLLDLVDSKLINGTSCLSEDVTLTIGQLWNVLTGMPSGTGEGQTGETAIGGTSVGNTNTANDAFSMMDVLESIPSVSESRKYRVWANGCYWPGDASWTPGTFLPPGGQDNPPF